MDDVISEIKKYIDQSKIIKSNSDDYLLMNSLYEPMKIDEKNFHTMENKSSNKSINNSINKSILFVDGGNSILFESANFCLGFIRIAGLKYRNNKRLERKKKEFYVFAREEKGKFIIKTFPETSFNDLTFDPEDKSLMIGKERCNISKTIAIIRRFAEIEFASESNSIVSENSKDIDFIILDGTLEARYPHELEYLNKLFSTKKACALSKTCSLTTKNGESMTKKLLDLNSEPASWNYHPVVANKNPEHLAEIYFVKLNEKSDYVFRFEIQKKFAEDIDALFSVLASNSKDPIFLGYPYGFVDVDAAARITEEESKMLKTKFMVKLGKDWNNFSKSLNSLNAHDILDKIKF